MTKMHQHEHEIWNRKNYPGTRQLCVMCGSPTGRCEDDALYRDDGDPLCEDCWDERENIPPDLMIREFPGGRE